MRLALQTLALSMFAFSCRAGNAPPPMPAKSAPVTEPSAYIPAAGAADAGAIDIDDTLGRPTATHTIITYALPWVILGQNVVDTRNGQRARIVPFGDVRIARDRAHFAIFDGRAILFGAMADANGDYRATALLEDLSTFTLSDDGAIGLWTDEKGTVSLGDATAKSRTVLARIAADAGEPEDRPSLRNVMTPGGRRVTWLDGERARFRDLDTGQTRDVRAQGKLAALTQIAGDTWVASFGDELVVQRISTGGELIRKQKAAKFLLADDGKTVAWEDASAKMQTLVLYDVDHAREVGRVAVQDDLDSKAPPKFAGACGGGTFSLLSDSSALRGTWVMLHRDCSLVDDVTVDLASGWVGPITSVTPGSDDLQQARGKARNEALCKRAQAKCEEPSDVAWFGQKRAILRDRGGKLALFEARTGRRLATLEDADNTKLTDLVVAPDGKTVAALDDAGEAILWDAATGKVYWKAKARQ